MEMASSKHGLYGVRTAGVRAILEIFRCLGDFSVNRTAQLKVLGEHHLEPVLQTSVDLILASFRYLQINGISLII